MIDIIGAVGGILLSISALPQAIDSINRGHSHGFNTLMLWLWFIGIDLLLFYTVFKYSDIFLFLNYVLNSLFSGVILYYKHFPRTK